MFIGGGTHLLDLMKGGVAAPQRLIDVSKLPPLVTIAELPDGGMRIGAAVLNSDFVSTSLSILNTQAGVVHGDCVHTTTTGTGAKTISGDVMLPSQPQRGGQVVLIDRGNTALTFVNPSTCAFDRQLSVKGGFNRWKDEGRDWKVPAVLGPAQRNRYQRHLLLPEVDIEGLAACDSFLWVLGSHSSARKKPTSPNSVERRPPCARADTRASSHSPSGSASPATA